MGHPYYSKAPITEAVIDLRVVPAQGLEGSAIDPLAEGLRGRFPIQHPIFHGQLAVAMSPKQDSAGMTVEKLEHKLGARLTDENNSRVLQLTTLGFTYSHFPPYSRWETFRSEAMPLWREYVSKLAPQSVTRVAVRYINRLDFPGAKIEPADYLTFYPRLPEAIPEDIVGMFMQVRIPQDEINAMAVMNQALVEPERENTISIVLDIDVFSVLEANPNDNLLWERLDALRSKKNDLFNACLTERSKELFR